VYPLPVVVDLDVFEDSCPDSVEGVEWAEVDELLLKGGPEGLGGGVGVS
jgi:hypothetical protein